MLPANNISGFKGVGFHDGRSNQYEVLLSWAGRQLSLGYFHTPEAAALAYARFHGSGAGAQAQVVAELQAKGAAAKAAMASKAAKREAL